MERIVYGIARGVVKGVKQPLAGATICASYFDGTPYDDKSPKYCTSSDKNGNFTVTVPDDFDNVRLSHIGQKPVMINLSDWQDFCANGKCNINLTTEEGDTILPELTISKQNPDGSKTKIIPIKKVILWTAIPLILIGSVVLISKSSK